MSCHEAVKYAEQNYEESRRTHATGYITLAGSSLASSRSFLEVASGEASSRNAPSKRRSISKPVPTNPDSFLVVDIDQARVLLKKDSGFHIVQTGDCYRVDVDEIVFDIKMDFEKPEWRNLFYEHFVNTKDADCEFYSNPALMDLYKKACRERMDVIIPDTHKIEEMSDGGFILYGETSLAAFKVCQERNMDACKIWIQGRHVDKYRIRKALKDTAKLFPRIFGSKTTPTDRDKMFGWLDMEDSTDKIYLSDILTHFIRNGRDVDWLGFDIKPDARVSAKVLQKFVQLNPRLLGFGGQFHVVQLNKDVVIVVKYFHRFWMVRYAPPTGMEDTPCRVTWCELSTRAFHGEKGDVGGRGVTTPLLECQAYLQQCLHYSTGDVVDDIEQAKFLLENYPRWKMDQYGFYCFKEDEVEFNVTLDVRLPELPEWRKLFYDHLVKMEKPNCQINRQLDECLSGINLSTMRPATSPATMDDGGFTMWVDGAVGAFVALKMCEDVCKVWVLSSSNEDKQRILNSVRTTHA